MTAYRYVIVGGGIAAGRGAEGIRKLDPEGSIALVCAEAHPPYQRPPLSKGYLTGGEGLDHVYLKETAAYGQDKVELITGLAVTALDRQARQVTLADGQVLGYERLLLATGSQPRRLPIPGAQLEGVWTLRTIEDADGIRAAAQAGAPAVVFGGSFIGSEAAAALAQMGLRVTVVFPEARLLERIAPPSLSAHLHALYAARGVRLLPGNQPARCEGDGRVTGVQLESGARLEAALVVMGVGVQPDTAFARAAGLATDTQGALLVDPLLCTSDPQIYAAGDIASWPDVTFGRRLRVEHWDVARGQGLRAGRNMAGEGKPYTALPYFFSDLFDLSIEVWGDLTSWDQTVLRGALERGSFAFFYFSAGQLTGALAAGRPEAERKPIQALVRARVAYADVAERLQDEGAELSA